MTQPIPVRGTVVCITRDELTGVLRGILDDYHSISGDFLVASRSMKPELLALVIINRLREARVMGIPDREIQERAYGI